MGITRTPELIQRRMTLDIQEVALAMGAKGKPGAGRAAGWSVDTRTQNRGDVYFALHGPNHDGHRYVAAAVEKGASAVVVDCGIGVSNELVVSDTLRALQSVGARRLGRQGDWGYRQRGQDDYKGCDRAPAGRGNAGRQDRGKFE